ncbi:MAG: dTDP-4-dehydrorhamnose 3,5-epimerase [Calditrichaeota bacterium]|nr:dTDP-4-dehydrorhamnose 3,5-epimerase [Calditrichota bacterium]
MSEISGVFEHDLRLIPDERGRLMEIFRSDWPFFKKFGQVYVTTNYPGVVKAWHCHKKQTDHVACVKGMIKLVVFDRRKGSPTKGKLKEFFIGEHNPKLVVIPPGVYHGWKCISETESIVVNCPDQLYNHKKPDQVHLRHNSRIIGYNWDIVFK